MRIIKILILCFIFLTISYFNNIPNHTQNVYAKETFYFQNMIVLSPTQVAFSLPVKYNFKYLFPISVTSPSRNQIINDVYQHIDLLVPFPKITFRKPLTELGTYTVILEGFDMISNSSVDLIGNFYFR